MGKRINLLVIDGQGGRLGQRLIEEAIDKIPDISITCVGTNSFATERMIKSGAKSAATGENAMIVACRNADIITGPLGIAIADSLMGEISPAMANAVGQSAAQRVLIPMNLCDTYVAGINPSSTAIIKDAIEKIQSLVEAMKDNAK